MFCLCLILVCCAVICHLVCLFTVYFCGCLRLLRCVLLLVTLLLFDYLFVSVDVEVFCYSLTYFAN